MSVAKQRVLVIGANGKIGRRLVPLLKVRGFSVVAQVRDIAKVPEGRFDPGTVLWEGDLEDRNVHSWFSGIDGVVFTAGSGGDTGGDKTLLVDLYGAMKAIDGSIEAGVSRFIMVSALRAEAPDDGPAAIRHYLVAKQVADDYLRRSGLQHAIIRPGRLTDEPGTGLITAGRTIPDQTGSIPRDDVAEVVARVMDAPGFQSVTLDLIAGATPIDEALEVFFPASP